MTFRRFGACLGFVLAVGLATTVLAADTRHTIHGSRTHRARHHAAARATGKVSAAARQERERRQDLERRIERLEQQYEINEPAAPSADGPAAGRPSP